MLILAPSGSFAVCFYHSYKVIYLHIGYVKRNLGNSTVIIWLVLYGAYAFNSNQNFFSTILIMHLASVDVSLRVRIIVKNQVHGSSWLKIHRSVHHCPKVSNKNRCVLSWDLKVETISLANPSQYRVPVPPGSNFQLLSSFQLTRP